MLETVVIYLVVGCFELEAVVIYLVAAGVSYPEVYRLLYPARIRFGHLI